MPGEPVGNFSITQLREKCRALKVTVRGTKLEVFQRLHALGFDIASKKYAAGQQPSSLNRCPACKQRIRPQGSQHADTSKRGNGLTTAEMKGKCCCAVRSASPGNMPINRTNVNKLMQEKFENKLLQEKFENPEVAKANYQPLVIVFQAADQSEDGFPNKASLLSADEMLYGLVLKVGGRVDALATDEELQEWADILCTYPMIFEQHDSHGSEGQHQLGQRQLALGRDQDGWWWWWWKSSTAADFNELLSRGRRLSMRCIESCFVWWQHEILDAYWKRVKT